MLTFSDFIASTNGPTISMIFLQLDIKFPYITNKPFIRVGNVLSHSIAVWLSASEIFFTASCTFSVLFISSKLVFFSRASESCASSAAIRLFSLACSPERFYTAIDTFSFRVIKRAIFSSALRSAALIFCVSLFAI